MKEEYDNELINGHYCEPHKQIKKYCRLLCSNCRYYGDTSFDLVITEKEIDIENKKLIEENKEFFDEIKRQHEEFTKLMEERKIQQDKPKTIFGTN